MSDKDDLVRMLCDATAAYPIPRPDHEGLADAILAAGWVSAERHQEALDAMALQVTYTEEGTYEVLRRFRETRTERDALAETVQRVRALCDGHLRHHKALISAYDLRAALDPERSP